MQALRKCSQGWMKVIHSISKYRVDGNWERRTLTVVQNSKKKMSEGSGYECQCLQVVIYEGKFGPF